MNAWLEPFYPELHPETTRVLTSDSFRFHNTVRVVYTIHIAFVASSHPERRWLFTWLYLLLLYCQAVATPPRVLQVHQCPKKQIMDTSQDRACCVCLARADTRTRSSCSSIAARTKALGRTTTPTNAVSLSRFFFFFSCSDAEIRVILKPVDRWIWKKEL